MRFIPEQIGKQPGTNFHAWLFLLKLVVDPEKTGACAGQRIWHIFSPASVNEKQYINRQNSKGHDIDRQPKQFPLYFLRLFYQLRQLALNQRGEIFVQRRKPAQLGGDVMAFFSVLKRGKGGVKIAAQALQPVR